MRILNKIKFWDDKWVGDKALNHYTILQNSLSGENTSMLNSYWSVKALPNTNTLDGEY